VQKTLIDIAESGRQPPSAANEAKALAKKLNQFETAIICVVWNDILQKTNVTSKALQETGIEIYTVVKLYDSLLSYFRQIRE